VCVVCVRGGACTVVQGLVSTTHLGEAPQCIIFGRTAVVTHTQSRVGPLPAACWASVSLWLPHPQRTWNVQDGGRCLPLFEVWE
jgi:hypothetical protein